MGKFFIFDDVLCINLDHRKDRWETVQEEFKPFGIKTITRIPGVYGKTLPRSAFKEYTSPLCNKFCPKSAIGCAIGHRRAWQQIVDRKLKAALVLEDDAYPLPDLNKKLPILWQQVPKDWDIVYLGGFTLNFAWLEDKFITKNVIIPAFPLATHAYVVSYKGAKKILNGTTSINYHIDHQLAHLYRNNKSINVYAIKPNLINQKSDSSYSDNQHSTFPMLDKMMKEIKVHDTGLDVIINSAVFSIGDFDFTTGRIIIVIVFVIAALIICRNSKRKK